MELVCSKNCEESKLENDKLKEEKEIYNIIIKEIDFYTKLKRFKEDCKKNIATIFV